MSPIKFSDIYELLFKAFTAIEQLFGYLTNPIRDVVGEAFDSDIFGDGVLDTIVEFIVNTILVDKFGDLSIIELLFGSGLSFILVLIVVKFFLGIVTG